MARPGDGGFWSVTAQEPGPWAGFDWTPMRADDLEAAAAIAARLHPNLPERPEVFAERILLFPDGCRVLQRASGGIAGYGIAYPWRLHSVPPLDGFVERLPDDADCLYAHDLAILPEARSKRQAERALRTSESAHFSRSGFNNRPADMRITPCSDG